MCPIPVIDITTGLNIALSERWATKRPDQLSPQDFIQLTVDIYGESPRKTSTASLKENHVYTRHDFASEIAWKRSVNVKDDSGDDSDDIDVSKSLE